MQYTIVHRDPQAFQQDVALEHIKAMCERAFGQGTPINSVRELDGGQFNNTYLIELAEHDPVILRVAPSPERAVFWHEQCLMRRELAMQPLLAPIAPLLPTSLMSDFTHQVLARDYLFRRWIPSSLWWDVSGNLTPQEHDDLWASLASWYRRSPVCRERRSGWCRVVRSFPRGASRCSTGWNVPSPMLNAAVWRRRSCVGWSSWPATTALSSTRSPARRGSHGDLWLFNLLIERTRQGPRIVGVLDADRGSWGDPLADWTFFLLPRRASVQEQALFWQAYGRPEAGSEACFRALVYQGLHQGKILSVARRDGNERAVNKAYRALAEVVNAL